MKHRVAGRKLGRTSSHRRALLRNLATELFDKERVRTTLMKAKELRPFAEKLLTMAKRESLHARRQILRHIHDRDVVAKMFDALSPRYAQRPGGYTRILKLGPRRGDSAEMAFIELVGAEAASASKGKDSKEKQQDAPAGEAKAPKKSRAGKSAAAAAATGRKTAKKKAAKAKSAPAAKKKASTKGKGSVKSSGTTRKSGKSGS